MTLTLLLDLDDTLLNTKLEAFLPAYFQALSVALAPLIEPARMLRALVAATARMSENDDFARTLLDVFSAEFYPQVDGSRAALDVAVEDFYDNKFPTLSSLTSPVPAARPLVDWALAQGFRVAVATDPLLPRKAQHHRVRWAGLAPEEFELVSAVEDFHFSKTHPAYYGELLGRMGWPEGAVLMVGNDSTRDIQPAQMLGLRTYQVEAAPGPRSDKDMQAHGQLSDLRGWIESANLSTFVPNLKSVDGVIAILKSTPAALRGLTSGLDAAGWTEAFDAEDWSMTELVCHLRDTEREIHHMQLKLFEEDAEPFIPRPDTRVWASQRDYRHEDGALAMHEFIDARRESVLTVTEIPREHWSRKARHAIFGRTNFLEVAGFIGDHDRLHLQQAWNIVEKRAARPA